MIPDGYVQRYVEESGDAVVNPLPGGRYWWLCEHLDEADQPTEPAVLEGRGRVACDECGTVWITWTNGGRTLAKAVVARIG